MLQALCVSNSPPSLSPQAKMVGRGWCYLEKMVISFTSFCLHKAPKHRETLLSNFKHQPWFFSWNRLQKHQPSATTWLWLVSQHTPYSSQDNVRSGYSWLAQRHFIKLETSTPMSAPGPDSLATFSTAHAYQHVTWWLANCIDPLIQFSLNKPIKIWRNLTEHHLKKSSVLTVFFFQSNSSNFSVDIMTYGARGGAVGWGTTLQAGRSRGPIPDGVTGFFRWHNPSWGQLSL